MTPKSSKSGRSLEPLLLQSHINQLSLGDYSPDYVIGVDEVGAGCLAGPLVAASFMYALNAEWCRETPLVPVRVFDSKTLSMQKRSIAEAWLKNASSSFYEVVEIAPSLIDEMNIYQARMLALATAALRVAAKIPENKNFLILIDGNVIPKQLQTNTKSKGIFRAVTKGDQLFFGIAAASILAKQHRDKLMSDLSKEYPQYLWDRNVGYPTPDHKLAIRNFGPTPLHRRSFNWI